MRYRLEYCFCVFSIRLCCQNSPSPECRDWVAAIGTYEIYERKELPNGATAELTDRGDFWIDEKGRSKTENSKIASIIDPCGRTVSRLDKSRMIATVEHRADWPAEDLLFENVPLGPGRTRQTLGKRKEGEFETVGVTLEDRKSCEGSKDCIEKQVVEHWVSPELHIPLIVLTTRKDYYRRYQLKLRRNAERIPESLFSIPEGYKISEK